MDSGITWHVPGHSPLSGVYHGSDGVLDFFGRCQELSNGTLQVVPEEIIGEGDRVIALTTVSVERHGQFWSSPEVHLWKVVDSLAVSFREFQGDQEEEDRFWSQ